jgi:serine/threonine protein kinase
LNPLSGTPLFMAPEVLTSDYGTSSDIWALAVTFYYIASAEFPFDIFGLKTLNMFSKNSYWQSKVCKSFLIGIQRFVFGYWKIKLKFILRFCFLIKN